MKISVIIPTINRGERIRKTIHCLTKEQNFERDDYEVLVVDGGSSDDTQSVVKSLIQNLSDYNVKLIVEPEPGVMPARHRGVQESRGEIISFVEDDARAGSDYLKGVWESFRDPEVHLAGGPCLPDFQAEPPRWLKHFWRPVGSGRALGSLSFLDLGDSVQETDPENIWALNFCLRRTTFDLLKGFNPDLLPKFLMRYQGDGETGLSIKIRKAGYKTVYHPDVKIYHETPANRMDEQHFRNRAYFQGVCDSYTNIRENRAPDDPSGKLTDDLKVASGSKGILRKIVEFSVTRMKMLFSGSFRQYVHVSREMQRSYRDGYEFHQNEARNDSELMDWILRPDYLDYRLPVKLKKKITYADRPYV